MATDLEKLVVSLSADLKSYERGLAKAQNVTVSAMRKMERDMQVGATRMEKTLGGIGMSLKGGIALGVAAAVASFTAFAKSAITDAAALGDLSDKIGINTDLLQGLQLGAVQANMSFEELGTGLLKFSKGIGEAANGEGELFKVLQANNVAITDAAGKQRPLNDLLNDFADLVKNAKNEQQALLLIVAGMGRGGEKFLEFLRNGSSGLKGFQSDLTDSGRAIDAKMIKKAQELDDKWAEAMSRMKTNTQIFILDAVTGFDGMVMSATGAFKDIQDAYEFTKKVLAGEKTNGTLVEPDGFGGFNIVDDRSSNNPLGTNTGPGKGSIANSAGVAPKVTKPAETDDQKRVREQAADAARREKEAIETLIETLHFELEARKKSQLQQQIDINLRKAGASATEQQKQQIIDATTLKFNQNQADEEAISLGETQLQLDAELYDSKMQLAQASYAAFEAIVTGGEKASDVVKNLALQMLQAATMASLFGEGPFASLFGTKASGGFFGSLFKPAGKAGGGHVNAGQPYVVGEKRPELFVPSQSGSIIPKLGRGGGGNFTLIDQRTNAPAVEHRRDSQGNVTAIIRDAVDSHFASGRGDKVMGAKFGISPQKARR